MYGECERLTPQPSRCLRVCVCMRDCFCECVCTILRYAVICRGWVKYLPLTTYSQIFDGQRCVINILERQHQIQSINCHPFWANKTHYFPMHVWQQKHSRIHAWHNRISAAAGIPGQFKLFLCINFLFFNFISEFVYMAAYQVQLCQITSFHCVVSLRVILSLCVQFRTTFGLAERLDVALTDCDTYACRWSHCIVNAFLVCYAYTPSPLSSKFWFVIITLLIVLPVFDRPCVCVCLYVQYTVNAGLVWLRYH